MKRLAAVLLLGLLTACGPVYGSCAEVQRAGAAPLLRDQDGYRAALDGDGDGVACDR